jgi:hypothetical protein
MLTVLPATPEGLVTEPKAKACVVWTVKGARMVTLTGALALTLPLASAEVGMASKATAFSAAIVRSAFCILMQEGWQLSIENGFRSRLESLFYFGTAE